MKPSNYAITRWSEKTLFSCHETAQILGVRSSTMDSLILYSELSRTTVHKRVLVHRKALCLKNSRLQRYKMSEEELIQLMQDINRENVRFFTVEVSFTLHDGRPTSYELTTHRRRNIDSLSKSSDHHYKEDADGCRKHYVWKETDSLYYCAYVCH